MSCPPAQSASRHVPSMVCAFREQLQYVCWLSRGALYDPLLSQCLYCACGLGLLPNRSACILRTHGLASRQPKNKWDANCALITPSLLSRSAPSVALITCTGLFGAEKEKRHPRCCIRECLEAGDTWLGALRFRSEAGWNSVGFHEWCTECGQEGDCAAAIRLLLAALRAQFRLGARSLSGQP